MNDIDLVFIKKVLQGYYGKDPVQVPSGIEAREFGHQGLDTGWQRHLSFKDEAEMVAFMQAEAPASAYCSVALYDDPTATPMAAKGWKGADLIFDIDAKDLDLDCRGSHAVYACGSCKKISPGAECSSCGKGAKAASLPCGRCVGEVRKHADMVRDIVVNRFGVPDGMVRTYFSGNEGYHVHVDDPSLRGVKKGGRAKVAAYMAKEGIEIDSNVTTDVSRIFRMPGTVSAKSGLAKIECTDPFREAVVFGGMMVDVIADCPLEFELNGESFGPYGSEKASIPGYAAAYMILKGLAKIST